MRICAEGSVRVYSYSYVAPQALRTRLNKVRKDNNLSVLRLTRTGVEAFVVWAERPREKKTRKR